MGQESELIVLTCRIRKCNCKWKGGGEGERSGYRSPERKRRAGNNGKTSHHSAHNLSVRRENPYFRLHCENKNNRAVWTAAELFFFKFVFGRRKKRNWQSMFKIHAVDET